MSTVNITHENNTKKGFFTISENEVKAGELTYTWASETQFIIDHTEVDSAFGGKGLAKKLVLKAVDFARENDFKIASTCSYATRVLEKDSSFEDVLI